MSEAAIRALMDTWAEELVRRSRDGHKVEFSERTGRGGVLYLIATTSPRFDELPAPAGAEGRPGP